MQEKIAFLDEPEQSLVRRFLEFVKIETTSDEDAGERGEIPSTRTQFKLAEILADQLRKIGCVNVSVDEHCYVYGTIPANRTITDNSDIIDAVIIKRTPVFLAHIDTSSEASGLDVKPQIISNYDGKSDINHIPFDRFSDVLSQLKGKTIITSDGTTLLGCDDKAGLAAIVEAAARFIQKTTTRPYPIKICFTPDEEIGHQCANLDLKALRAGYGYTVDGGIIGELEYETFNAAMATIRITGANVHPGSAKNKMANAVSIGTELHQMLPQAERPELTCGYDGFYHLLSINGTVTDAKLVYILRDHDNKKLQRRKETIDKAVQFLRFKYPLCSIEVDIRDQYKNMKQYFGENEMYVVEMAEQAMNEVGVEPKVVPIRGGTDGAALSERGLPCVNIFTGGDNFHGRFEFCCVEWLEKACQTVERLMKLSQERQ